MAKRYKNSRRCIVCSDNPINKDNVYLSGRFYINDSREEIFYCSDCLTEPNILERYRTERTIYEKNFPKKRGYGELSNWQKGPLGWAPLGIVIAFFLLLLVYGISIDEPEPNNPVPVTSGEQKEWNADNSIEGPVGNFDDQSKR